MIRAAVDVSPLVQTRAGTARHVRGLLGALAGREGIEAVSRSFGGTGKAASVARDTWWYYAGLPRSARGLDLLHCTTFRGPLRASVPFTVTLHDLALVRHPELFPRWHRLSGRAPDNRLVHFTAPETPVRPGDVATVAVTYAAPHHLVADAPTAVRRTRSGDAWEARTQEPTPQGVGLGMPTIGVPAPLAEAPACQ